MRETWGPWDPRISNNERLARIRGLRALCLGLARQHVDLLNQLKAAEADPQALKQAELMFAELPSTVRRRILALYAELARPFVVAPRLANKD